MDRPLAPRLSAWTVVFRRLVVDTLPVVAGVFLAVFLVMSDDLCLASDAPGVGAASVTAVAMQPAASSSPAPTRCIDRARPAGKLAASKPGR